MPSWKTSGRYDVASTTWSTPAARALASTWCRNGTPAVGSIGLGVLTVSGRSRVPLPPTSRTASVTPAVAVAGTSDGDAGRRAAVGLEVGAARRPPR